MNCVYCDAPSRAPLCGDCLSRAGILHNEANAIASAAQRRYTRLLIEATTDDTARFRNVVKARIAANDDEKRATFEQRYQEALERGDGLSKLLEAERAAKDGRAWVARVDAALSGVEVAA